MSGRLDGRHIAALVVAVALAVSLMAAPAAAQESTEPAFVATLDEEGNAEVGLTLTFDLTTDGDRAAFEELRENETAREASTDRFGARLEAVADDASDRTGREMSISGADIDLRTEADGDRGIVTLTATWTNLAAVGGDELTVTEPFASGFEPDRTFRLVGPEGATVADATPQPAAESGTAVEYDAGTALDGFEVTFQTSSADENESVTTDDGSGFGAVVTVAALLAVALLARRRN